MQAGSLDTVEAGAEVEGAELLPPIERPGKVICIGLNYRAHAEEGGREAPELPTFFAKFATSLRPAGATVELPKTSRKIDYEVINEYRGAIGALNSGEPFMSSRPDGPLGQSVSKFAKELDMLMAAEFATV